MDEELRRLERLAVSSGDLEDKIRFLRHKVRSGDLAPDDIICMGFFGDEASASITGIPPLSPRLSDYLSNQGYLFGILSRWLALIFQRMIHSEFIIFPGTVSGGDAADIFADYSIFAGQNEWVELMFGYRGFLSITQILGGHYSDRTESSAYYRTGAGRSEFTGEIPFYLSSLYCAANAAVSNGTSLSCDREGWRARVALYSRHWKDRLDFKPFAYRRSRRLPIDQPRNREVARTLYAGILMLLYILVRRKHPKAFTQTEVDLYFRENYHGAEGIRRCLLEDHYISDEEAIEGITEIARLLGSQLAWTREYVNDNMLSHCAKSPPPDWILNELRFSDRIMLLDLNGDYLLIRDEMLAVEEAAQR